jgi:hypothetical protein
MRKAGGLTTVVGIDMATEPSKTAVSIARPSRAGLMVATTFVPRSQEDLVERIAAETAASARVLLAVDAPLGWPAALSAILAAHRAGSPISCERDAFFARATDHFVAREVGKSPLAVGSNYIARTAHAALAMLEQLRRQHGCSLQMAWEPGFDGHEAVIEVYPAGTLASRGLPASGYKKPGQRVERERILRAVREEIGVGVSEEMVVASDHVLDSLLCTLAGADFLEGRCLAPADLDLAAKEGWIWVMRPERARA